MSKYLWVANKFECNFRVTHLTNGICWYTLFSFKESFYRTVIFITLPRGRLSLYEQMRFLRISKNKQLMLISRIRLHNHLQREVGRGCKDRATVYRKNTAVRQQFAKDLMDKLRRLLEKMFWDITDKIQNVSFFLSFFLVSRRNVCRKDRTSFQHKSLIPSGEHICALDSKGKCHLNMNWIPAKVGHARQWTSFHQRILKEEESAVKVQILIL